MENNLYYEYYKIEMEEMIKSFNFEDFEIEE